MDRPGDADVPSGEHPGRAVDRSGGRSPSSDGVVRFETRYRHEYYDDMRAATRAEARPQTPKTADPDGSAQPHERDANGKPWAETTDWSHRVWAEYQAKYPPEERPPVDRSNDPPGSWRGAANHFLDQATSERAEHWHDRNKECEQDKTTPKMRTQEAADPDRHLTGLEYRLKGCDRIKEKVADHMKEKGSTVDKALTTVKDAIRYTFVYKEGGYTNGVKADLVRMENNGFEQVERKNSWESGQYKGINSRWREPSTGLLFEVQFHTKISFEAKQLTHEAYERLRSKQVSEFEELALEAFQKRIFGAVPIPPGACDITDYP